MNNLLKEFLSYILAKDRNSQRLTERVRETNTQRNPNTKPNKDKQNKNKPTTTTPKVVAHKPGEVWQTTSGKWSAKKSDGTSRGGFSTKQAAEAWRDGRSKVPGEVPKQGDKEKQKTPPAQDKNKPAQDSQQTTTLTKALQGKSPELDELATALASGNPATIQAVIDKYGVSLSSSGKLILNINGRRVDLFSKDKAKKIGAVLQNELKKYGISLKGGTPNATGETQPSPFAPSRFVPSTPKGESPIQVPFNERGRKNDDGSISVTYLNSDGSTREVSYESIPDTTAWLDDKFSEWENSDEGKNATEEQKTEMKRTLTLSAFCIQRRHALLSGLLEKSEEVAIYDTPERKKAFVGSVESRLVDTCTDAGRKQRIQARFTAYRNAETPDAAEAELVEILKELDSERESNSSSPLRTSGAIPAIAESFTALVEIKSGRNAIVPLRENYEASDVLSLSDSETRGMSASELQGSIRSIYVGVSVKLKKGGSSSMIAKTEQSVFIDPPGSKGGETRDTLRALSKSTDIFLGGRPPRTPEQIKENRAKAKEAIASRVDEINKYFDINPPIKDVDELVKFLANGEPECVDGKVVARRQPPPPIGPGTRGPNRSKPGHDPKGNPIDVDAWGLNFAMQLSWTAIYNTNVTGQAFASHSWTTSGVKKADGVTSFAKQEAQPLKQARKGSTGETYQPDTLVSFNEPQSSIDDVRNGNPCK